MSAPKNPKQAFVEKEKLPSGVVDVPKSYDEETEADLQIMIHGVVVKKFGREGNPHSRALRLTSDHRAVMSNHTGRVELANVKNLILDQSSANFQRFAGSKYSKKYANTSVTLELEKEDDEGHKSLDVAFKSADDFKLFTRHLPMLIKDAKKDARR